MVRPGLLRAPSLSGVVMLWFGSFRPLPSAILVTSSAPEPLRSARWLCSSTSRRRWAQPGPVGLSEAFAGLLGCRQVRRSQTL